jgi:hypothetical protein
VTERQEGAACDGRIAAHLERFADRSDGEPYRLGVASGDVTATGQRLIRGSHCIASRGVDLTRIEGIDETTALTVLSEIGPDMSR